MGDDSLDANVRVLNECFDQFLWQSGGKVNQQVSRIGRRHFKSFTNVIALATKPTAIATDLLEILITTKEMVCEIGADSFKVPLYG